MTVLRTDIERALDELVGYEEGMRFQGLAVVLGKLRWPELIACERKKDLGLDAYARANQARDGICKGLASSITAEWSKVSNDAEKAKRNFSDLGTLIFVTSGKVGNQKRIEWTKKIHSRHGLDLHIISREDILSSLMMPGHRSLCASFLGLAVAVDPAQDEVTERICQAALDIATNWTTRVKGHPIIALDSVQLNVGEADSNESFSLSDIQKALSVYGRFGTQVSGPFPIHGPAHATPAFRVRVAPVPRCQQYYAGVTTTCTTSLRLILSPAGTTPCLLVRPLSPAGRGGPGPIVSAGGPWSGRRTWTVQDLPGSPASHPVAMRTFSDPGRPASTSPLAAPAVLPPLRGRRRRRRFGFRGSIASLHHPLCTLHDVRCRPPCNTRSRLAGCASAGAGVEPAGSRCKVSAHRILLARACPGAI